MTLLVRAGTLSALLLAAACDVGSSSAQAPETSGTSEPTGTFTLLYRDDFEQLDLTRWQIMTHSWASNLALFSAQAVSNADGNLVISLKPAPDGTVDDQGAAKPFFGAEVRSRDALTYGKIRARAKLAKGSAVASSLVSIYTPWPADNWNELDIECLGATPSNVQFNTMVYTGAPVPKPAVQSVTPTPDPHSEPLGFDASQDFHIYTIEWTPAGARFSVDDELKYSWSKHIDLMTLPQNVLLTIWASSSAGWAGAVTDDTGKAQASYDWVELYKYSEL